MKMMDEETAFVDDHPEPYTWFDYGEVDRRLAADNPRQPPKPPAVKVTTAAPRRQWRKLPAGFPP
jgi:hypothetical protein